MYTAKSNFHVNPRTIGGLLEDVFQNGLGKVFHDGNWSDAAPVPVNIKETEAAYELDLVAPGLKKEDFKINLEKNVLHISYEHKTDETKTDDAKWLRKEYRLQTFKRSFTLNDKVNTSGIQAKYNDGVLQVVLPKKENAEPTTQEITVA
jgi:HSP20 family protein